MSNSRPEGSGDIESTSLTRKPVSPVPERYPRSVFFIVSNEFCERFSYYGMRAVLTLYFINVLKQSESEATEAFHIFSMACYFTPLLGAFLADSVLGKFNTIMYLSILYSIGNIVLSWASWEENAAFSIAGLVLVALGTGGIKPCVAAFGGDQFGPTQGLQLQQFFSLFYMSINAGSLISMFVTPIFREEVDCSSRHDCFPLAFGVPAVLMVVALVLFVAGKSLYKINPAAKGNIVVDVVGCTFYALYRRILALFRISNADGREHWLEHADDKYDAKLIKDVKSLLRVLLLYIPLPLFWALYDQQGSRWTLQATRMNGDLFGVYRVKPDQIQVINPLLIITMIPLFEYAVYPVLRKCNLLTRPLQKITTGGILAALSFVITALVQIMIERHLPVPLLAGQGGYTIVNVGQCPYDLHGDLSGRLEAFELLPNTVDLTSANTSFQRLSVSVDKAECNGLIAARKEWIPEVKDGHYTLAMVTIAGGNTLEVRSYSHQVQKPATGGADVRIFYDLSSHPAYLLRSLNMTSFVLSNSVISEKLASEKGKLLGATDFIEVDPTRGPIDIYLPGNGPKIGSFELDQGGSYAFVVLHDVAANKTLVKMSVIVGPNDVSVFWQAFQYLVMTAGEIMFSVTGLEFSYSQAPSSMKSVLQAAWLLTVAFGNLVVVIIAKLDLFDRQSYEFLFFAALMALDMVIFATMACFYVYVKPENEGNNGTVDTKTGLDEDSDVMYRDGHAKGFEKNSQDTSF